MTDHLEHCAECGAYLATGTDQELHADWHTNLKIALTKITQTADHADAFHRLYKGQPQ